MTVPPFVTRPSTQAERGRDRPVGEQPAPRAEQHRMDDQVPAIHQAGREQRLDEVTAAVHLELRTHGLFQGGDRLGDVAGPTGPTCPRSARGTPRGHVLGRPVQRDRVLVRGSTRPEAREDVVRPPPEQQVERLGHQLLHLLADLVVEVVERPAAQGEVTARVLVGSAGRLVRSATSRVSASAKATCVTVSSSRD